MSLSSRIIDKTSKLFQVLAVFAAVACVAILLNDTSAKNLASSRQWLENGTLRITIDPRTLGRLIGSTDVFILDTRSRNGFAKGHVLGAHNIPVVELPMRMGKEVPRDQLVVIYCGSTKDCEQDAVISGKPTLCTLARRYLESHVNDTNVRVLVGLVPEFAQAGLLVGTSQHDMRVAHLNVTPLL